MYVENYLNKPDWTKVNSSEILASLSNFEKVSIQVVLVTCKFNQTSEMLRSLQMLYVCGV